MAQQLTLRGLGLPYFLSRILADYGSNPSVVASGATQASATQIAGDNYVAYVNSGTSAVKLPAIGGDFNAGNCDLGDDFVILNNTAATIVVFAKGTESIVGAGATNTGSTGVSIATLKMGYFVATTTTTWAYQTG